MSSNVYLRVFGLKGITPRMVNNHPKGKVWCRAELGDTKLETVKIGVGGGSLAVNEVGWSTTEGFLKWEMSREEIQNLKTVQPKIKVHLMIQSSGSTSEISMGYVLVDMRDLSRSEIKNQPLKVHGMTGAELTVSAKLVVGQFVKENPTIGSGLAGSVDVSFSGTEGGPSVMSSLAMSTDSVRSVLRLALEESKKSDKFVRFSFSVALEDYHHLALLCEPVIDEDHREQDASGAASSGFPQPKRSFWLCWTVFDKMFQSDEFQYGQPGPKRVRDTIKVECPLSALESSIEEASPLRVFLCTQDKLLGVANVPLPEFSRDVLENELLTSDSISETGWGAFGPPQTTGPPATQDFTRLGDDVPAPGIAGIKLTTCLTFDDVLEKKAGTAAGAGAGAGKAEGEGEGEGSDGGYDEDAFEGDDDTANMLRSSRAVTFAAAAGSGSGSGIALPVPEMDAPAPPVAVPEGQGMDLKEEGQQEQEQEEADEYADDRLRHFRVSVQAKSVTGFRRPSHVSVGFVYPYLGTSSAVRTQPAWVLANSEATIDGGSGSYECVMSRASLRQKLTTNPLKIAINSKSAMGSTAVGACVVDLNGTFCSSVHSFRCPVTGRSFKSRAEYVRHRHVLMALKATGRIEVTPPVDPAYIRVSDSYLGLDSEAGGILSDGAKMRVMVVVEELGKVGNELAQEVKPGYKMHGGGLYVSSDDGAVALDPSGNGPSGDNTGIQNPLDRAEATAGAGAGAGVEGVLSPYERKKLELLTLEWEGWRKQSEDAWRDALRDKERMMRKQLEMEGAASLANRADDLRRAHEEAGRLEVRLRAAIDSAEKSRGELSLKEEQMNLRLAQKTSELQLLQKRVRDEAKAKVDSEKHRGDSLASQLETVASERDRLELRAKNSEKEYEAYRASVRSMPESLLREEVAKVKAQLAESRAETERERRVRSETELEKEHFRSQMHRLALALKREREKSNTLARQELEQLRLEFLAREERYVLDGDREELRTIRNELSSLRAQSTQLPPPAPAAAAAAAAAAGTGASPSKAPSVAPSGLGASGEASVPPADVRGALSTLLSSGLYDSQDSIIQEMKGQMQE